jgi:hypothetical protein
MTDALLLVLVLRAALIALGVDIGALLAWVRRRWGS